MNRTKNPWEVLGIPRSATTDEIKAQYRKLALSLHPDKHTSDLTPDERKSREERFKEVTVAYQVATSIARSREEGCPDWDGFENSEKWRSMWERMEGMLRSEDFMSVLSSAVKGTFKDITKMAMERLGVAISASGTTSTHRAPSRSPSDISSDAYSSAGSDIEDDGDDEDTNMPTTNNPRHIFRLDVSLDEVHARKTRKVRLFLHDHPNDPIFVSVNYDMFPEMECEHTINGVTYTIVVQMVIKPHPVYYWDNMLDGWDLYTTVPILLSEYFTGCTRMLPPLGTRYGKSTDPLKIDIPSFSSAKNSIKIDGHGLQGRGSLYVSIDIRLPTQNEWDNIEKTEPCFQDAFLSSCKKLENPNAPHRTSS
ncbi:molecular chaperone [Dishui Lake large algae virus 1]|nr:molecular chaperone [Dishui Lake large algae virus 1]